MDNVAYLKAQEERVITLNDWCNAYYDCDIVPFPMDKVNLIEQIVSRTIELYNELENTNRRVNEQGNDVEPILVTSMTEILNGDFKKLGSGYPDIKGTSDLLDYPLVGDSKIRPKLTDKDSFRMFYTSTPKEVTVKRKNLTTSYHLLFLFQHDGNGKLTGNYRVADLYNFKYLSKGRNQEGSYTDILNHNNFIVENL
jgi:hypothetical protein